MLRNYFLLYVILVTEVHQAFLDEKYSITDSTSSWIDAYKVTYT